MEAKAEVDVGSKARGKDRRSWKEGREELRLSPTPRAICATQFILGPALRAQNISVLKTLPSSMAS